ncbi:retrovirus-related pol polyprotein from transposon TNT 1-94, partial [Tanacetum coccineum]
SLNPLDSASYTACKYVKLIQELLGYVRDTCPDIHKPSEKLVAVTPINWKKIVRFAEPVASSRNIPKVTNISLLSSIGVKPSTSASGSKSSGIQRMIGFRDHQVHTVKGAKALCSVCNECLFDVNHAMCLIDHVNSMNVRAKSASKKNKKRKEWKPTGKVFNLVGYKWKPTGRTFILVGNALKLGLPPLIKPMRVASVNGKKEHITYVDDSSLFNAAVRNIRTDNGTEFVNQTLRDYYEQAEAVATACYTQNRSIIRRLHGKPLYELVHNRKPDLSYLHVFGTLCYPNNDSENLGKLQAKADIGIFIGYAPKKKAYRIYNRRTRKIIETIHVDFDELTAMASEQSSLEPALHEMTPATPSLGLIPNPPPSAPFVPPSRKEWDLVFQPVFDEFYSPPASVASPVPVVEAPAPVESTGSPSSISVDPKTYKEALTQSCWIEAMQEELHEFERLEV